jgi:hypothetical protein
MLGDAGFCKLMNAGTPIGPDETVGKDENEACRTCRGISSPRLVLFVRCGRLVGASAGYRIP